MAETNNVRIEIDTDEPDRSKAVARVREDDALSLSGEDGESEDAKFDKRIGKSVQKRLARLSRNLTRSFEQQRAEDEARHQREIAALRRNGSGLEVDRGANTDAAHEAEMVALQTQLELASEKGDSKEVARITRVMSQKDAQYWSRKQSAVSTVETRQPREAATPKQQPTEDPRLTTEAKKWIKANADWWDDGDYRVERQAALVIDEELDEEGLDRETPEYFTELSKRLKAKLPGLEVQGLPVKRSNTNGHGRSKVEEDDADFDPRRGAIVSHEDRGAAPTSRQRGRRATLSREQIQTMRAMGMDPDDNESVLTFWEESQALAAQGDE